MIEKLNEDRGVSNATFEKYLLGRFGSLFPEHIRHKEYNNLIRDFSELTKPLDFKKTYHVTASMGKLPIEVYEVLDVASSEESSFDDRTKALEWIVDNFRQEIHTYFQKNYHYNDITPSFRVKLLFQVEHIVKAAKNELFELHRKKKQGKLLKLKNSKLTKEIGFFKKNWMNVFYQNEMLTMIRLHNNRVDQFCKKYEEKLPLGLEQMLRLKEILPSEIHDRPAAQVKKQEEMERLKKLILLNFDELP